MEYDTSKKKDEIHQLAQHRRDVHDDDAEIDPVEQRKYDIESHSPPLTGRFLPRNPGFPGIALEGVSLPE